MTSKLFVATGRSAQRWYHAVVLYLKDRLKLDVSPEKSQIINLRKRESEFLGFTIRANKKGQKRVAHTGIKASKKQKDQKRSQETHSQNEDFANGSKRCTVQQFCFRNSQLLQSGNTCKCCVLTSCLRSASFHVQSSQTNREI